MSRRFPRIRGLASALALLASLALSSSARPASAQDAAADSVTARVEPAAAGVGEPIAIVVDAAHEAGGYARALEPYLDRASPWVFLGSSRESGATSTRLSWRFVALDAEETTPPEVKFTLRARADEDPRVVRATASPIELASALAEGEDAPRPLLGLRELPDGAAAGGAEDTARALLLGAFALAVVALALTAWRLRRRALGRLGPIDTASAADRIAVLAASDAPLKARHFELTRVLRAALDARRGWTDEELARALEADPAMRGRLGEDACEAAADVLRRAAPTKYAGARPTEFAVRETFEAAERAVRALKPRDAAPPAVNAAAGPAATPPKQGARR